MIKPVLFVVGAVIVKGSSPNAFAGTEKLVRTSVAGFTTNVAVIVPVS